MQLIHLFLYFRDIFSTSIQLISCRYLFICCCSKFHFDMAVFYVYLFTLSYTCRSNSPQISGLLIFQNI